MYAYLAGEGGEVELGGGSRHSDFLHFTNKKRATCSCKPALEGGGA